MTHDDIKDLTPIMTIDRRVGWTYPPPFPNGKGASRLMIVRVVQLNVLFEEGLGFSLLGDRERRAQQRQYPSVASGRWERGLVGAT